MNIGDIFYTVTLDFRDGRYYLDKVIVENIEGGGKFNILVKTLTPESRSLAVRWYENPDNLFPSSKDAIAFAMTEVNDGITRLAARKQQLTQMLLEERSL